MKQIALNKYYSYFLTDTAEIKGGFFDEKLEELEAELAELMGYRQ